MTEFLNSTSPIAIGSPMVIVYRLLSDLHANPLNVRIHPKEQVAKLKKIIRKVGFRNPILIDKHGMILCGHGRFLAAEALGMREVPTILVDGLSEADVRALVLADNVIHEKAGYDKRLVRSELGILLRLGTRLS